MSVSRPVSFYLFIISSIPGLINFLFFFISYKISPGIGNYINKKKSQDWAPIMEAFDMLHIIVPPIFGNVSTFERWLAAKRNDLRSLTIQSFFLSRVAAGLYVVWQARKEKGTGTQFLIHNHWSGNKRIREKEHRINDRSRITFLLLFFSHARQIIKNKRSNPGMRKKKRSKKSRVPVT